jgi:hypothetical protein
MLVPVCASVSKFSVRGTPSDVILPLLVKADEDGTNAEIPTTNKIIAINTQAKTVREVKRDAVGINRSFQIQLTKVPHIDPGGIPERRALRNA